MISDVSATADSWLCALVPEVIAQARRDATAHLRCCGVALDAVNLGHAVQLTLDLGGAPVCVRIPFGD
jgi:hypothetical protein